jgi:hypothetical protein
MHQKVEHFRLNRQQAISPTKLSTVRIKRKVFEPIGQDFTSSLRRETNTRSWSKTKSSPKKTQGIPRRLPKRACLCPAILGSTKQAATSLAGPAIGPSSVTNPEPTCVIRSKVKRYLSNAA